MFPFGFVTLAQHTHTVNYKTQSIVISVLWYCVADKFWTVCLRLFFFFFFFSLFSSLQQLLVEPVTQATDAKENESFDLIVNENEINIIWNDFETPCITMALNSWRLNTNVWPFHVRVLHFVDLKICVIYTRRTYVQYVYN